MNFSFRLRTSLVLLLLFCSSSGFSQEANSEKMAEAVDVATQLAGVSSEQFLKMVGDAQESVVVVEMEGRDGNALGIGSGFVVSSDGLIATNLHVIGDARPINVRLYDGREFRVTEIYGTNKSQDVALIRIPAEELKPLKLGRPDDLKQGQPIFALGNPQGLEHSVVIGVVSGFRDNEGGMSLIQLAIPIEQGNSGGPLLDMQGAVHGLLTLKSQVTENLGYAVKVNAVRDLLESPNPVPMSRWLTIGALNPKLWEPLSDVNWRHRAGRISVDGTARGFGGRALCLSRQVPPQGSYELAVDVKIVEEDGAAGLVFHADGGDIHYGFYPSSGSLRLSRFDGATVYTWNVLADVRSAHYRPGEWNRLKVRIADDVLQCYCNEELVIEYANPTLTAGRMGIVKFRHTTAEFKRFQFAKELPSEKPTPEIVERVAELANVMEHRHPPSSELREEYADLGQTGQKALHDQARILEQRAEHLRRLASEIHERQVRTELLATLQPQTAEPVNLLRACLLISALDNPELDVDSYLNLFDQLAAEFIETLPAEVTDEEKIGRLKDFLFDQQGYHGSRTNYYHASNSYINEVIDDREGLPLTLSIVYIEMARRAGLDAAGIGLPGHFIARVTPHGGQPQYIDVFEGGTPLTVAECRKRVSEFSGLPWSRSFLDPQPATAILQRMLRNLIRVSNGAEDHEASLRYIRTILALDDDAVEDRLYKAVLCYSTERYAEALQEVETVLKLAPPNIDLRRVQELREAILAKQPES